MPYPLPLTRTEAYLAYKAGVIQQSDLKPSLAIPRNGIDAWLAYWTELTEDYPKRIGKNLFNKDDYDKLNAAYFNTTTTTITANVSNKILYIPCDPNTRYTVSKVRSAIFNVGYTTQTPAVGVEVFGASGVGADTVVTITTGNGAKYLVVRYYQSAQDTKTEEEIVATIQIEKGSATPYEPYTSAPLILQEEEAYIAYLSGVINEYPEKCLRRVGAYLRYIISARWGRPDHPLNREELYLSLIKTQFIPSGDPSSDIEIDGTAKAAFVDVKMYGDTFQQTYTGKNLLKIVNTSLSQNGVTYTYDPATNIVTLNGTCSTDNTVFNLSGIDINIPMDGQYVVSYEFVSGSVSNATQDTKFQLMTQSYSNNFAVLLRNSSNSSTATKSNVDYVRKNIRIDAGVVLDNYKIKLQVEKGEAATPYEPYVGGIPSPNPEYPQTVQTVTGTHTVEVVGKNLFDKNHPNDSKCYVNNSGVLTSGGNQNLSVYIKCEPNTTYTVSKSNKGTNNRLCVFDTETEPAIGVSVISTVGTRVGEDNSPSYTITTGENAHYLGVFYRAAATTPSESEIKDTIQIEKGSTATAYAPYSKHTYPINLGKNLLSAGLEIGGWTIGVGSTIAKATNNNAYRCNAPIAVKPNTEYIFSINGAAFDSFRVVYANAAGVILSNEVFTGTIKTPDNCYQIVFYSSAMKTAYPNIEDIKAQLEVGNTVTSYAEYFTPIELCKLGTYQDYIWKDGGDWKVHRANGYYALTYSVSITPNIDTNQPNTTRFQFTNILAEPSSTSGRPNLKCSHFEYVNNWNYDSVGIQLANYATEASNTRFWFRIPKTIATTFDQLKSWLANNTVELYYPLATATDTIITNQPLIDQLEALVKGGSEEGTTHIKLSTPEPNLPGLLYVEAAKYVE